MTRSISVRVVLICSLIAGAAACVAQTYTPPPPPLTTLPPCPADTDAKKRAKRKDCDPTVYPSETKETKGKKTPDAPAVAPPKGGTAADKFPFPGEQPAASTSAAKAFPYPGEAPTDAPPDPATAANSADTPASKTYPYPGGKTTDVPHDPAAEKKAADTPAGKAYPFPGGATPDMPSDAVGPPSKPDEAPAGSSSSESGSSSSSSSDDSPTRGSSKHSAARNPDDDDEEQPKLKDQGSEGKRSKKVIKPQTDTERVDEDLSVAKFYGQSGNFTGAYMRAKDAVKTQPEYPEGHFVLGEAAKRLNKKDEAVAEFQAYLKLTPDGKEAKAAEKAIEELK